MRKIALNPIKDVLTLIREQFIHYEPTIESVALLKSEGRILAKTLYANMTIPQYKKSTVDGYAIAKSDAEQTLKLLDALTIENPREMKLEGCCVYVPTGGRVPNGADVMVKIEETRKEGELVHFRAYPHPENIIHEGDDMDYGDVVKTKGESITAFDIGAFASLGFHQVEVIAKPKVIILSTGNELVTVDQPITLGQTRDINGATLSVLAANYGFEVIEVRLVKDTFNDLVSAVQNAEEKADLVLISGGSSMGKSDFTYDVIKTVGDVLSDGMALKPGKPTIVGKMNHKPIIGLPGHPVSAIMVFKILMQSLCQVYGVPTQTERSIECTLSKNIRPAKGRDTYQMITVEQTPLGTVCHPTSGKSGMITLLTKSDGYTLVRKETKQIEAGTVIQCTLF